MQALGTIAELRTTERLQWLLDVDAETAAVLSAIGTVPGARVQPLTTRTGAVLVELADADPAAAAGAGAGTEQDVLRVALALGAVREFSPVRPTLTDLFRDIVSADKAGGADDDRPSRPQRDRAGVAA